MIGGARRSSSSFNDSFLNSVCRQLLKCVLDCIGRWSVGGRFLATQVVAQDSVSDAECGRSCFLGDACRFEKASQIGRGGIMARGVWHSRVHVSSPVSRMGGNYRPLMKDRIGAAGCYEPRASRLSPMWLISRQMPAMQLGRSVTLAAKAERLAADFFLRNSGADFVSGVPLTVFLLRLG